MTRNWLKSSRSYTVLTVALPSYLFPPDRIILADIDRAAEFPSFPEIGKVCRRNSIGVALRTAGIRIRTVEGRRREGSREHDSGRGVAQQRGKSAARDVYHTLLPLLSSLIVRPSVLFPVLIWTPALLPSRCSPSPSPPPGHYPPNDAPMKLAHYHFPFPFPIQTH